MITDYLQEGDKVIVSLGENRGYGFGANIPPDGTVAVIVDFTDCIRTVDRVETFNREPGIYRGRGSIIVRYDDGQEHKVFSHHVQFQDKSLHQQRLAAYRAAGNLYSNIGTRIGDLPKTDFVEWDIVRLKPESRIYQDWGKEWTLPLKITRVEYYTSDSNEAQHPYIYTVESLYRSSGSTRVAASDLILVERGNIWREMVGESPVFSGVREEAELAMTRYQYDSVRAPNGQGHRVSMEESYDMVKNGLADCTSDLDSQFKDDFGLYVIRFHNRDLGERVRMHALRGTL